MTLASGTRLGPYELVEPLGSGGMGEVFRAHDPRLGRDVAIKVIRTTGKTDPSRLRRFEEEARAVASLSHPNVLTVFDAGSHDGAPYVAFELLEGETLRARLGRGRLRPRRALEIVTEVCRGLEAAHGRGLVHRDLKPENLFLTTDGRVRILDFGLAKLTQGEAPAGLAGTGPSESDTQTAPGVILGTLGYLSPEQARCSSRPGPPGSRGWWAVSPRCGTPRWCRCPSRPRPPVPSASARRCGRGRRACAS
jgi:serine/threonine protein kinase